MTTRGEVSSRRLKALSEPGAAGLEPSAQGRAIPSGHERRQGSLSSSMEDMVKFSDTTQDRGAAMDCVDRLNPKEIPDVASHSMRFVYSLSEVSPASGVLKQAKLADSGATYLDRVIKRAL